MADLHGEITSYLDAIGTEDGSAAMIAAMKRVGTTFTIDEFTSMGMHEKYLEFAKGGVEFLVLDGIVDTIFFRLVAEPPLAAYRDPEALIPGIRYGMSRDAVIELLGEPLRNEPRYLLYPVGSKFLSVYLPGGTVKDFTVQGRDLQSESESASETLSAPIAPESATAPIDGEALSAPIIGEIALFLDAAGTGYGDKAMLDLIAALGTPPDSHDIADDHGPGTFLVFESAGVDVQYRDQVLTGVLIHVADDGRRPYPRLDALVDRLSFPATRADVTAALGSPKNSLTDRDLYDERGRFVMFHYTGDTVTTISIVHVPASR